MSDQKFSVVDVLNPLHPVNHVTEEERVAIAVAAKARYDLLMRTHDWIPAPSTTLGVTHSSSCRCRKKSKVEKTLEAKAREWAEQLVDLLAGFGVRDLPRWRKYELLAANTEPLLRVVEAAKRTAANAQHATWCAIRDGGDACGCGINDTLAALAALPEELR